MFNQAGYNLLPFNITLSGDVFASMTFEGVGEFEASASYITSLRAEWTGEGSKEILVAKVMSMSGTWKGLGTIVIPVGKLRLATAQWQGIGVISIGSESFTVEICEYFGTLQPGDRLEINTETFTVRKNNVNDLENFDGNFIELTEGVNQIKFEDSESERTILLRLEWRDRWL